MHIDIRSTDKEPYHYVLKTIDGYDACTLCQVFSDERNLARPGDVFDLDLTVPDGTEYCIRVDLEKGMFAHGAVAVISNTFTGTVELDTHSKFSQGVSYIGMSGNFLTVSHTAPSDGWSNWIRESGTFKILGYRESGILGAHSKVCVSVLFNRKV